VRKQISPQLTIIVIIVVVLVVGVLFWRAARTKRVTGIVPGMGPMGRRARAVEGEQPTRQPGPERRAGAPARRGR